MSKIKKIRSSQADIRSEIWIGQNILSRAGTRLGTQFKKSPFETAVIIADSRLRSSARILKKNLEGSYSQVELILLEASEKLKDLSETYSLYGELLERGVGRNSVLFAMGGGVIGDVSGFLAGTYLRGIPWVCVPTTLLAQVDSSVGGKTGINHEKGKNLIGLFHQPIRVLCDTSLLKTLPPRERLSGLGEIIKYGLIYDSQFFLQLEKNWKKVMSLEPSFLSQSIHRCLSWKAKVVSQDFRDTQGVREILNFGHTLGHALEVESGYGHFTHGEAVIWGMRVASLLSVSYAGLDPSVQFRIESFLSQLPVPQVPKSVRTGELLRRLKWDKKRKNGKTRFILLKDMGKPVIRADLSEKDVADAIEQIRS